MKTTPSIEAARTYLNDRLIMPFGDQGKFTLLHRRHRLWLCKGQQRDTLVHVCKPRKLLHYMQGSLNSGVAFKTNFVGPVVDGSHWHTERICYKCRECGKVFEGGVAYAIKVGLKEKEKFEV